MGEGNTRIESTTTTGAQVTTASSFSSSSSSETWTSSYASFTIHYTSLTIYLFLCFDIFIYFLLFVSFSAYAFAIHVKMPFRIRIELCVRECVCLRVCICMYVCMFVACTKLPTKYHRKTTYGFLFYLLPNINIYIYIPNLKISNEITPRTNKRHRQATTTAATKRLKIHLNEPHSERENCISDTNGDGHRLRGIDCAARNYRYQWTPVSH